MIDIALEMDDKKIQEEFEYVEYPIEILIDRHLAEPIYDPLTGEVLFDTLTVLNDVKLKKIIESQIEDIKIVNDLAEGVDDSILAITTDNKLVRLVDNVWKNITSSNPRS